MGTFSLEMKIYPCYYMVVTANGTIACGTWKGVPSPPSHISSVDQKIDILNSLENYGFDRQQTIGMNFFYSKLKGAVRCNNGEEVQMRRIC